MQQPCRQVAKWVTMQAWFATMMVGVCLALLTVLAIAGSIERGEVATLIRVMVIDCAGCLFLSLVHLVAVSYIKDSDKAIAQHEFENDQLELGVFRKRYRFRERLVRYRLTDVPESSPEDIVLRQPRHQWDTLNYRQIVDRLEYRQKVAAARRELVNQAHRELNALLYDGAVSRPFNSPNVH